MVQKAGNIFEIISPNLNPDGGVGRTQKQKALKQFVIVGSRLKPFVFQIHFKHLAVAYIFEYRNIDPRLCFSRRDHNSIIPDIPVEVGSLQPGQFFNDRTKAIRARTSVSVSFVPNFGISPLMPFLMIEVIRASDFVTPCKSGPSSPRASLPWQ